MAYNDTSDSPKLLGENIISHNEKILWYFIVLLGIIFTIIIGIFSYNRNLQSLSTKLDKDALLHMSLLRSELDKQSGTPLVLAGDTSIQNLLASPTKENAIKISQKLLALKKRIGSDVIYIINTDGVAISSSNWNTPQSFVGANYAFRDYFKNAMKNGTAFQYALGSVSKKPGLYYSARIDDGNRTLGIAVVKLDFTPIEKLWAQMSVPAFVIDNQNIILIGSSPNERFKTFKLQNYGNFWVKLDIPNLNWQLILIGSKSSASIVAIGISAIFLSLYIIVLGVIFYIRYKQLQSAKKLIDASQYQKNLEQNVAARTHELNKTNRALSKEISERKKTEAEVIRLQSDLVQANKLATLGQVTAGVAHEINQPLATIMTLAQNNIRMGEDNPNLKEQNLNNIVKMCGRISTITGELRSFSRKSRGTIEKVSVAEVIDSSILLMKYRVKANKVKLIIETIAPDVFVMAEKVRFEQIIVNLLQNAVEACEKVEKPCVRIRFNEIDDFFEIRVSDNGTGITPEARANLFMPFNTTKPKGLGLGLVISSEIAREFGGKLELEDNNAETCFCLKLIRARGA